MTGLSADHIEKLMSNPKIRTTIEANIEIIKDEIIMFKSEPQRKKMG